MKHFAVIETGGKQYKVAPGDKIRVEKLTSAEGAEFAFDKVLLRNNAQGLEIGTPYISGARVMGKIQAHGRDKKKIIFRYHSKTRYRKLKGHRQHHTEVEITSL